MIVQNSKAKQWGKGEGEFGAGTLRDDECHFRFLQGKTSAEENRIYRISLRD